MTTSPDVELANRNGRLHPSQRWKILDLNFWAAAVLVVAGIVGMVALAVKAVGDVGDANQLNEVTGKTTISPVFMLIPDLLLMVLALALTGWFAFVCRRRLAEVRDGRLVVVTGWTHDFGKVSVRPTAPEQYPIYLYSMMKRIWFTYLVVNGHSYRIDDMKLQGRLQGERTNIVLSTPRTKILINVLPA
ncbi:hypothetical protein [Amycolatopsis saalfeldensis]|uniref:Uncharacterized protein n=1 Tax=Amycolatopsis saalfeldensis TaxID=394193 RepID=A0A1H8XZV0_9PSEU|nr:hypothetical protein [Amycolatopsis saalfeldensis]SEP45554.1 hypothetical protein SAMN04489732_11064 [Amycolatopsis saalfeldensis]